VLRFPGRRLADNRLHETQNILDAVMGFTHQQVNPLLISSLIGYILGYANEEASPV
jgi:hypothetical protein